MKRKTKRRLGFAMILLLLVAIFVANTIEYSLLETIVGFILGFVIIAIIMTAIPLIVGDKPTMWIEIFKSFNRDNDDE